MLVNLFKVTERGVKMAPRRQQKLTRMMWGQDDAKVGIRWWFKQSTIDCNSVVHWKNLVEYYKVKGVSFVLSKVLA